MRAGFDRSRLEVGLALAALLVLPADASARQASPEMIPFRIELSSAEQQRAALLTASIASIAGEGSFRARQAVSGERPGFWRGPALRAAWLFFVDLPLASLGQVLNHEAGHLARVHEEGGTGRIVLEQLPWPFPLTGSHVEIRGVDPTLGAVGAGSESSQVVAEEALWANAAGPASPLSVALFAYAKLDVTAYILNDLAGVRTEDSEHFFVNGAGDPSLYIGRLAVLDDSTVTPDELRGYVHDFRRGAVLNAIDYELWMSLAALVMQPVNGSRPSTADRWLRAGSVRFAPSLAYSLGPLGPELSVRTHAVWKDFGGRAYYRQSKADGAAGLKGFGMSMRPIGSERRITPRGALDIWTENGAAKSRVEIGAEFRLPRAPRLRGSIAIGGKSQGYLAGFPQAGGAYISGGISATVR